MAITLGFVSAILPDLDLDGVLSFAGEHGFGAVEVMCWPVGKAERRYAGVTHLDVSSFEKSIGQFSMPIRTPACSACVMIDGQRSSTRAQLSSMLRV